MDAVLTSLVEQKREAMEHCEAAGLQLYDSKANNTSAGRGTGAGLKILLDSYGP